MGAIRERRSAVQEDLQTRVTLLYPHVAVSSKAITSRALVLDRLRLLHSLPGCRGGFSEPIVGQLAVLRTGYFHMDVGCSFSTD